MELPMTDKALHYSLACSAAAGLCGVALIYLSTKKSALLSLLKRLSRSHEA